MRKLYGLGKNEEEKKSNSLPPLPDRNISDRPTESSENARGTDLPPASPRKLVPILRQQQDSARRFAADPPVVTPPQA